MILDNIYLVTAGTIGGLLLAVRWLRPWLRNQRRKPAAEWSYTPLSFSNAERLRAQLPPRRTVVKCDSGFAVTDSDFVTTDEALARSVAWELDRVDPVTRRMTSDEARDRMRKLVEDADEYECDAGRLQQIRAEFDLLEPIAQRRS